jgi:Ca2+-dependent lipid-binding protein
MSKLPLAALISGVALSLAMPVVVQGAATDTIPQGAETIVGKGEPKPKKEKEMKPVTPLKRDVSNPQGAETIVSKGEPRPKKEKEMKPVTPVKRDAGSPKDADQPQGEPAVKPKR